MRQVRFLMSLTMIAASLSILLTAVLSKPHMVHAATSICGKYDTVDVNGKAYVVQNNVWGTSATQCLNVDTTTGAFTVTTSGANQPTNGAPAAYPSIFKGCHWGNCTTNSGMPVRADSISTATSSWSTTQPSSGIYDVAYDIWFNSSPTTTGQPDGAELMIWLNYRGSVQPVGSRLASGVSIAGATWDVWYGNTGWNVISYVRSPGTTSVSNLDLRAFFSDAISRGRVQSSWYLIAVEAGFEPWQSGAGLASNSFSVTVSGGGTQPTPTRVPNATATPTRVPNATATPTPGSGGGVTATMNINNQWSNGYCADVTIRNGGSQPVTDWSVNLTISGRLTQAWNVVATQSGSQLTLRPVDWNRTLQPGQTVSAGFCASL